MEANKVRSVWIRSIIEQEKKGRVKRTVKCLFRKETFGLIEILVGGVKKLLIE